MFKGKTLSGHAVNMRCPGILVAETGKVGPTHIIDEDKDDVGINLGPCCRPPRRGEEQGKAIIK